MKGVGASQIEIEKLLTSLENEKRKYETQNNKLKGKEAELQELQNEYKYSKRKLEGRQKEIINLAKQEASQILTKPIAKLKRPSDTLKKTRLKRRKPRRLDSH